MITDAPASVRLNPAVLEIARWGSGIDQIKVEPASRIVSILQVLSENRLRIEITSKSIAGNAKGLIAIAADAEGPLAIAAAVLVAMAVLAVVVTARATGDSRSSFEPSRRFEQLWTTRVASSQIEKRERGDAP
jgi:hypothetical protein